MGLEGDAQDDYRGDGDQRAEEHDGLRKRWSEQERPDEEREPDGSESEQDGVFCAIGEPPGQSGTSSGKSQPPPTSLLIWVANTSESLNTLPGGPSA